MQVSRSIIFVSLLSFALVACGAPSTPAILTEAPTPVSPLASPVVAQPTPAAVTNLAVVTPDSSGNTVPPASNPSTNPTPATVQNEPGGEGGEEGELTFSDAAQRFSISYPQSWTRDTSVKQGVKFVGGDDSLTVQFVTRPAGSDLMAFAKSDAATLPGLFPGFKQVSLAASSEVKNSIVLGFEAQGTSSVTTKPFLARGDRYYMLLSDGRIAILTVVGPANHYDREGVRDTALTLKVLK